MRQPIVAAETGSFLTLRGVQGREWLSHRELCQVLEETGELTGWARDLILFGDKDLWLPREGTSFDLTMPTIEQLGLVDGASAHEVCRKGEGAPFHLNVLAAVRGLEICLDRRFSGSMDYLLINMMFIRVNGHPPGLFIICPGTGGRHKVDVVNLNGRLPSKEHPGPIRVLFRPRFSL